MGEDGVAVRLRLWVRPQVMLDLLTCCAPPLVRAVCQQHPADSEICPVRLKQSERSAFSYATASMGAVLQPRSDFV